MVAVMRAEASGNNVALVLDCGERLEMLPCEALRLIASAELRDQIRFAAHKARHTATGAPAPVDGEQAIDDVTGSRQAAEASR